MVLSTAAMVSLVHNQSLGAICVWQFVVGYCGDKKRPTALLEDLYYVYPVVSNGRLREEIVHTNKSLWKVREKLRNTGSISSLLKMSELVTQMHGISSDSIALSFLTNLISFDWGLQGVVLARKTMPSKLKGHLSTVEQEYLKASRQLGRFRAEMSHGEFQIALGVK
ncbi:hypothetical protein H6A10_07255 [Enorma massiliensis]|uniref:three component ABC system middle component n=1 Tax=Enorma massiliensis TaxID=1472761 RepID=UPI00195E9819|nr:three component ABC system middle component [Enorma massiliensis]MBM6892891.1 hypothetical protein [Enorma massiliensis]